MMTTIFQNPDPDPNDTEYRYRYRLVFTYPYTLPPLKWPYELFSII